VPVDNLFSLVLAIILSLHGAQQKVDTQTDTIPTLSKAKRKIQAVSILIRHWYTTLYPFVHSLYSAHSTLPSRVDTFSSPVYRTVPVTVQCYTEPSAKQTDKQPRAHFPSSCPGSREPPPQPLLTRHSNCCTVHVPQPHMRHIL